MGELDAARDAFQAALALSKGKSRMAARNLGISEAAMRRGDAEEPLVANPHHLQRLGKARFRLLAASDLQDNG
jgi:hypothetical protein